MTVGRETITDKQDNDGFFSFEVTESVVGPPFEIIRELSYVIMPSLSGPFPEATTFLSRSENISKICSIPYC